MKIVPRLLLILSFIAILTAIIVYARGYRLDFNKRSMTSTGILAVASYPKAAKVYVNGELKGVTDINLTVLPGKYQVEIKKDGFTAWSKTVVLRGELVESLEALLFPINPSLSPLTNLGITKVIPIDQTDKILIFSQNESGDKDGIYVFESNKKPLSFLPPLQLIILEKNLPAGVDFKTTTVYFSPDYRQAIFNFEISSYLLSLEEENKQLFDITTSKEALLAAWEEEKQKDTLKILETYPKEIRKIATDSFQIVSFSPDETKMLYLIKKPLELPLVLTPPPIGTNQTEQERILKKDRLYVYDKKEDKNYPIIIPTYSGQLSMVNKIGNWSRFNREEIRNSIMWYSDSKHLVINEQKMIVVVEYDDMNKQTVYSGPFDNTFFAITTDGKIIVLANLNPEANKLPDLYLVGIK